MVYPDALILEEKCQTPYYWRRMKPAKVMPGERDAVGYIGSVYFFRGGGLDTIEAKVTPRQEMSR